MINLTLNAAVYTKKMQMLPPGIVDVIVPVSGENMLLGNCFGYISSDRFGRHVEIEVGFYKSAGSLGNRYTINPQVTVWHRYTNDGCEKLERL